MGHGDLPILPASPSKPIKSNANNNVRVTIIKCAVGKLVLGRTRCSLSCMPKSSRVVGTWQLEWSTDSLIDKSNSPGCQVMQCATGVMRMMVNEEKGVGCGEWRSEPVDVPNLPVPPTFPTASLISTMGTMGDTNKQKQALC